MFHQAFFDEAGDHITDFERELLVLEEALAQPGEVAHEAKDPERLNLIFRCAHSLKGGAATFGFTEIATFTHGLETLLDKVRNGSILVTRDLTQLLFEALDQLKSLLSAVRGESASAPDATDLRKQIAAAAAAHTAIAKPPSEAPAATATATAQAEQQEDWWGLLDRPTGHVIKFKSKRTLLQCGKDLNVLVPRLLEAGQIRSFQCDVASLTGAKSAKSRVGNRSAHGGGAGEARRHNSTSSGRSGHTDRRTIRGRTRDRLSSHGYAL